MGESNSDIVNINNIDIDLLMMLLTIINMCDSLHILILT